MAVVTTPTLAAPPDEGPRHAGRPVLRPRRPVVGAARAPALGGETWFARRLATLGEDLRACRPTIFMAVPRVWEKYAR
jgi:hypothetical protein